MKVVILTQGLEGAIPHYRLKQPLEWCRKKGLLDYQFLNLNKEVLDLQHELDTADVCVWQCQTGWNAFKWSQVIQNVNKIENRNRLDVFEYDDNLFDIHPYNKKYNVFGTKEVWIDVASMDMKKYSALDDPEKAKIYELHKIDKEVYRFKLWKDGQDGFKIEENVDRMNGTKAIIKNAGLVTVTTRELGKKLCFHTGRTKPVAILPNLIDFDYWKPQKPNDTGRFRICWAGGDSHYQDWKVVEEALIELQKERDFDLVIAGQKFEGIHKKFKNVIFLGWHSDIRTYPMHMRELKADIGICPLVGTDFDKGKSAIKWEEYSALQIPTIASNVSPYKEVIKQGKTGVLVHNTTSDWVNQIKMLMDNKELRLKIAAKALKEVKEKWSVDRSIEWYEAYNTFRPTHKKQIILAK